MIAKIFRLWLCALLMLCAMSLRAEDNLSFKTFDIRLGLSNNTIRDIEQDKYGCIWIATDEGLNRICGSQVQKFYKQEGDKGLSGNELNCLLNDSENSTMWIGTQRAGLIAYNYDTDQFRTYRHDPKDPSSIVTNEITRLIRDNDGNIWLSTYWKGIDCFDPSTSKFTHFNTGNVAGLKSDKLWSIAFDEAGKHLYAAHEAGGFSVIDIKSRTAKTFTTADGLPSNVVHSILVDGDNIWLGTDHGLCLFRQKHSDFTTFNSPFYAQDCTDIKQVGSELWIAMERRGVVAFDKKTHQFRQIKPRYTSSIYDAPELLYKSEPTELFFDSFGNILVGTLRDGVAGFSTNTNYFFIDNHNLKNVNTDLSTADIQAIVALDDQLLYATNGFGILGDMDALNQYRGQISSHILAMIADADGVVWFCDPNGGLTQFNPASNLFRHYDLNLPQGGHTRSLYDDGNILMIGSYQGISFFDKTRGEIVRQLNVGNNFIRPILKDDDGNLFVGTFGDGLYIFDRNLKQIANFNVLSGFPSNSINDLLLTDSHIWVATSEGLLRIDRDNFGNRELVVRNLQSINSLIKDNDGNVWYSTGTGIGVIKTNGHQIFFERELPIIGFNNASVAKDSSGRLFFGTNRGVLTFKPESVLEYHSKPVPMLSDFIIHGHSKDSDIRLNPFSTNDIELSYDQNSFTIYITTLDFFFQESTFEYRLVGLDDSWYSLKDGHEVTYRSLPYGKYEFQVRNADSDIENARVVSLNIHIMPPIWLRWWAKTFYVILLGCLAYFAIAKYKSRIKRKSINALEQDKKAHMQELHEERLKFFTNITHELRTPLTLIMGPLDDITRSSSLDDKDRWKIQVIQKNAQRLLNLVNQILDFRKTETQNKRLCVSRDNIVAAVNDVAMKYIELNRNPKITISVNSPTDNIPMYFDKEVITMILDNLISNALKYTENGLVSISIIPEQDADKRTIKINVKDTGYGISPEALPHIFDRYYQEKSAHQASGTGIGLSLVRALVDLHQASIAVESAKDVGTSFTVTFDRDNDYPDAMHSDIEPEKATEPTPEAAPDEETVLTPDKQKTDSIVVLMIEDNPDILEYVEQSFSGIFDVRTATNGRDGLEIAKSIVPDIIVTDVMMPVMDGIEMSRLLKNDMITSHIPIIMLTAKDSSADREAGYKIGVDSYLTKPFNASLLLTRINNIIASRHMMSEYFLSQSRSLLPSPTPSEAPKNDYREKLNESLSKIDREFIERINKAILENLSAEKVNIDYLTDCMCMSRATLYRKIKALTGMSTNEYIRQVRMQKARDLMLEGTFTISEISDKVGCSSPTYFRETFKAVFGISPSDYLKTLKP